MKTCITAIGTAMLILLAALAGCTGTPGAPPLPSVSSPGAPAVTATGNGLAAMPGDIVSVSYTGKFENGSVFDSATDASPVVFTLGNASVIDGLNEAIAGMTEGEEKTVQIPAAKAYGDYNASLVWTVNRTGPIANTSFVVGRYYRIHNRGNDEYSLVRVLDLTPSSVTLDGNSPLAGMNFTFTIRLLKIARP